jgi:hypothetical protein
MATIEERVNKLEVFLKEQTNDWIQLAAHLDVLRQGLREVCGRLGTDEEQFEQRFWEAKRWYEDRLLQKASDAVPSLAALIDTRPIDQVPTSESPPRILENP